MNTPRYHWLVWVGGMVAGNVGMAVFFVAVVCFIGVLTVAPLLYEVLSAGALLGRATSK